MKHIKCDFRSKASIGSPGWTYVVGSKAQNSTSSEYGHVAYQIKRNHTCSNIIGNILPAEPPPPPHANTGGLSVKIQLFQNILHIKFKYIINAAKW